MNDDLDERDRLIKVAGAARRRFELSGDIGGLDDEIGALEKALALTPMVDIIWAMFHDQLACSRYDRVGSVEPALRTAELDAAIAHQRSVVDWLDQFGDADACARFAGGSADPAQAKAAGRAKLGGLLAERFDTARANPPADAEAGELSLRYRLDEAISVLGRALALLPESAADWRDIAALAGSLHYDRYKHPWSDATAQHRSDLDSAIELLLKADAADELDHDDLVTLMLALMDKSDITSAPGDLDTAIECSRRLLDHPDFDPEQAGNLHILLGDALAARAWLADRADSDSLADLASAAASWEVALGTEESEPDRTELLTRITLAYWDICGVPSRAASDDLTHLVDYGWRAWHALSPEAEIRPSVGTYLAAGLMEKVAESESLDATASTVSAGLEVLGEVEPRVRDDPTLSVIAHIEQATFLVAQAQLTGSRESLAAGHRAVVRCLAEVRLDDPATAAFVPWLAVNLGVITGLGMQVDEVEPAIELIRTVLRDPPDDPTRSVILKVTLGMLYGQRAERTGSLLDVNEAIRQLTDAFSQTEPGDPYRLPIAWNLGSGLLTRYQRTGDRQDRDAAKIYLDSMGEAGTRTDSRFATYVQDMDVMRAAAHGMLRMTEGIEGDLAAFDDGVRYYQMAVGLIPPGHVLEGRMRMDLGIAYMLRGANLTGGQAADFRSAAAELTRALDLFPAGHGARPVTLARLGMAIVAQAHGGSDPAELRAANERLTDVISELGPDFTQRARFLAALGGSWWLLYRHTGDASALSSAAVRMSEACDEFSRLSEGHPAHAGSLMLLSEIQRARGLTLRAREAGLAGLRSRGREVMLQSGTSRGLEVARTAAAEAAQQASLCLADRESEAAIEMLELGRGLILHAATSVADLPELLSQAGHADLADEWRHHDPGDDEAPWDTGASGVALGGALMTGEAALDLPSDLRARALTALAGPALDRLVSAPTLAQLKSALAETDADALVYLLGPEQGRAGCAIAVLAAGGPPQIVDLPLFRSDSDRVMDRYAAALAQAMDFPLPADGAGTKLDAAEPDPESTSQAWRQALDDLCDWAGPAVVEPLLRRAGQGRGEGEPSPGRPPRLVLVPVGRLSQVPWHAARHRDYEGGRFRYACEEAVFSYAASGRQLVDVAQRPARVLAENPVVVGNFAEDLRHASAEAQAIRDRCYPAGRYLGPATSPAARPPDGDGTPAEVLELLPGSAAAGASLVHLAGHAFASGSAPGQSYLELASEGKLLVETVLRRASGRPATAAGGLVVLAACGSDVTAAGPDEALTLATAFLAAGAVNVVGTRWKILDGPAAPMMFMFHRYLTEDGLSPRDALRAAQLWMLDPDRAAPVDMPASLAARARRPVLAEPIVWAALTHQGR